MVFEIARQGGVGWRGKAQNLAQHFFGVGEYRWRQSHGIPWLVFTCCGPLDRALR
jgi:hypothetical protein